MIDRIYPDAADSVQWYSGAVAYRMEYESTGYSSIPQLQGIEAGIIYDFAHELGGDVPDGGTEDNRTWRATPADGPGLMLYAYDGSARQEPGTFYRASFRMKIDDNSGHVLVAAVRIVQDGGNLLEQQIFSDDFAANEVYQELEYDFTTNGTSTSGTPDIDDVTMTLPEDIPPTIAQVALDYQVEYHGNRTLWVDQVIIEDRYGDRLFDSGKDADLLSDVQWAFAQDAGSPTIRGYYVDEPEITEIAPMRYVNNLLGPVAPGGFSFRETIKSTVNLVGVSHQYLLAGLSDNQDHKLLVDRYPLEFGMPAPGDPDYNDHVQGRWEGDLIPFLHDAATVAAVDNKSFWYAAQAHRWGTNTRDPHPREIRCMVNLGLVYGAKGIFYFLYTQLPAENAVGLVDVNF